LRGGDCDEISQFLICLRASRQEIGEVLLVGRQQLLEVALGDGGVVGQPQPAAG